MYAPKGKRQNSKDRPMNFIIKDLLGPRNIIIWPVYCLYEDVNQNYKVKISDHLEF